MTDVCVRACVCVWLLCVCPLPEVVDVLGPKLLNLAAEPNFDEVNSKTVGMFYSYIRITIEDDFWAQPPQIKRLF